MFVNNFNDAREEIVLLTNSPFTEHARGSPSWTSPITSYEERAGPAAPGGSIEFATSKMLSRRIATARPLRAAALWSTRTSITQQRCLTPGPDYPQLTQVEDPDMNGGYINPPPIKRQFRDPHADWWDKQERRNYGEPVHEDNDILGIFSPEEYTHTKTGKGLFQISCFVAVFLGLCGVVSMTYPDKPSAPREFEGGLETELGGPNAVGARAIGEA